jgi:hypothetical protein
MEHAIEEEDEEEGGNDDDDDDDVYKIFMRKPDGKESLARRKFK